MTFKDQIKTIFRKHFTIEKLKEIYNSLVKNKRNKVYLLEIIKKDQSIIIDHIQQFDHVDQQELLLKCIFKVLIDLAPRDITIFEPFTAKFQKLTQSKFENVGMELLRTINYENNKIFGIKIECVEVDTLDILYNESGFCFFNQKDIKVNSQNIIYISYKSIKKCVICDHYINFTLDNKNIQLHYNNICQYEVDRIISIIYNENPTANIEVQFPNNAKIDEKTNLTNNPIISLKIANLSTNAEVDLEQKPKYRKTDDQEYSKKNNYADSSDRIITTLERNKNTCITGLKTNNNICNDTYKLRPRSPVSTENKKKVNGECNNKLHNSVKINSCFKLVLDANLKEFTSQSTESEHMIHQAFNFEKKQNNFLADKNLKISQQLSKSNYLIHSNQLNTNQSLTCSEGEIEKSKICSNIFNNSNDKNTNDTDHGKYTLKSIDIHKKEKRINELNTTDLFSSFSEEIKAVRKSSRSLESFSFSLNLSKSKKNYNKKPKIKTITKKHNDIKLNVKRKKISSFDTKKKFKLKKTYKKNINSLLILKEKLFDVLKISFLQSERNRLEKAMHEITSSAKKLSKIYI
ncbi:hypothetical protein COBT_001418 [Conglomerata obtusa]